MMQKTRTPCISWRIKTARHQPRKV